MRRSLPELNTIVVKLGSTSLCHEDGKIDLERIKELTRQIVLLLERKLKVILVSSGAVAAGRNLLQTSGSTLVNKQAAAAIGQPLIMGFFRDQFQTFKITTAQVLLTHADLHNRRRYLSARNTLENLLNHGMVPIINENDTVSTEEIQFSDNDFLGALCTNLVSTDLFIILSDINGIAESDPRKNPDAAIFPTLTLSQLDELRKKIPKAKHKGFSRGGIATKLEAPLMAAQYGVPTIIANSRTSNILPRLLDGEPLGTYIQPTKTKLNSWKAYIAHALKPQAGIIIDEGAVRAISVKKGSLLASGILKTEGLFQRGDGIRCLTENGVEIARGIVEYSSKDIDRIAGRRSGEIKSILGFQYQRGVIHRDNMFIIKDK